MLQLSPSGNDTKVSINIINLEFVASYDALDPAKVLVDASGYASRITDFSVSLFTDVMEKISDIRAENGAEQNRITNSLEFMEVRYANMQTVHGRIMDADIASESTRFGRNNALIQTSAAMAAQANQLTNVFSTLIQ
jgi:flagellin-like hook-associated protein FlgL